MSTAPARPADQLRDGDEPTTAPPGAAARQVGGLAGWVDDGKLVCPLHSLTFDCKTGESPCRSLKALRRYQCVVQNGSVQVLSGKAEEVAAGALAVAPQ